MNTSYSSSATALFRSALESHNAIKGVAKTMLFTLLNLRSAIIGRLIVAMVPLLLLLFLHAHCASGSLLPHHQHTVRQKLSSPTSAEKDKYGLLKEAPPDHLPDMGFDEIKENCYLCGLKGFNCPPSCARLPCSMRPFDFRCKSPWL